MIKNEEGFVSAGQFFVSASMPPTIPSTGPIKNPLIVNRPTIDAIRIPTHQTFELAGLR
jgi:hypothetical protein